MTASEVEVVVAHSERATLRVGDTFVKVDSDLSRLETEVAAIGLVPVPTPRVLWVHPPALALERVPGRALGALGGAASASAEAWAATGSAILRLHTAPLPPWPARESRDLRAELDRECAWLIDSGTLSREIVERNRAVADAALRPWTPAFVHGDLQIAHVFIGEVDGRDTVTGIIDWSEAGPGDPMADLATLTLGHEGHLDDLLAGYGTITAADRDAIVGHWSLRSLLVIRWLTEHGFDPFTPGAEVDVLRARM